MRCIRHFVRQKSWDRCQTVEIVCGCRYTKRLTTLRQREPCFDASINPHRHPAVYATRYHLQRTPDPPAGGRNADGAESVDARHAPGAGSPERADGRADFASRPGQKQRSTELAQWREANPQLAKNCRAASEALAKVQTEFLSTLSNEINDNPEVLIDGEFMLNEFIDRYGPRLAHLNGVLQVLAQLGSTPNPTNNNHP